MSKEIRRAIEESGQPLQFVEWKDGLKIKHQKFYLLGNMTEERHQELVAKLASNNSLAQMDAEYALFYEGNSTSIAEKMIFSAGTVEIMYQTSNEPLRVLTTGTRTVRVEVKKDYEDSPGLAEVAYESESGIFFNATLDQDEGVDVYAEIDERREVEKEYIATNPVALTKAMEKAVQMGIVDEVESQRIQNLQTTERVFRLNEILGEVLKKHDAENFLGEDLAAEASMVGYDRASRYRVGQQSVGMLNISVAHGMVLEIFPDHDSWPNNPTIELPIGREGEYEYFGDKYSAKVNDDGETVTFKVERQNGNTKTLTFPLRIPQGKLAEINNKNSFDWVNYDWVREIKLEHNFK